MTEDVLSIGSLLSSCISTTFATVVTGVQLLHGMEAREKKDTSTFTCTNVSQMLLINDDSTPPISRVQVCHVRVVLIPTVLHCILVRRTCMLQKIECCTSGDCMYSYNVVPGVLVPGY